MKHWIYRKAFRIYEKGNVKLDFSDRFGHTYFKVYDHEKEKNFRVKIHENLEEHCDCYHGLTNGVNGDRCPHKIAVNHFINYDIIRGDISTDLVKKSGLTSEEELDRPQADDELSSKEKKMLREMLSCEICGSDSDINLHRLNRKGLYVLRNIMPLCGDCHRRIHGKEKGHINK